MANELPYDGFLLETSSPDANSPGGRRRRHMFAIENGPLAEPDGWTLIDQGRHILEKARALGVPDNGYKIVDA